MKGELRPADLRSEFSGLLAIFFIFSIFGYYYGMTHPEIYRELISVLKQILSVQFIPYGFKIFALVVVNNLLKTFLSVILGYTIIYPFMFASFNGFILGLFIEGAGRESGAVSAIISILPHGVIEIPAAIFSASIGLKLGMDYFRGRKLSLSAGLTTYRKKVIPLILLAAFIESFITPIVASIVSP